MQQYNIQWLIPEQLLYLDVWGDHDLTTTFQIGQDVTACFDASPAPAIHLIVNDGDICQAPHSLRDFADNMRFLYHERLHKLVMVGTANPLVDFLSSTVARLARRPYHRTATLTEAVTYLRQHEPTLHWDAYHYAKPAHC
jgi:hypothetical protein